MFNQTRTTVMWVLAVNKILQKHSEKCLCWWKKFNKRKSEFKKNHKIYLQHVDWVHCSGRYFFSYI